MQAVVGAAALIAAVYGLVTGSRKGMPLFYRIVTYAFACYALGTVYDALKAIIAGTGTLPELTLELAADGSAAMPFSAGPDGFSIGIVGYAGMFFFLFSSYFGALDSLADGRERAYRRYRLAALWAPALIVCEAVALSMLSGPNAYACVALVPVAATAYYAVKHLVMPDVEMGIIRVMRPYNGCILVICLLQPLVLMDGGASALGIVACAVTALATLASLPLTRSGVSKWFR